MTNIAYLILAAALLLTACTDNKMRHASRSFNASVNADTISGARPDTVYMYTGFYFLAEKKKGVLMQVDKSTEIYSVAHEPFASVNNIAEVKLDSTALKEGMYTELCMTFNNEGTKDLQQGTGNPLYPKMAVVIAGKLICVVQNNVTIKTGVMCVGLVGYSKQEMESILAAVKQKR